MAGELASQMEWKARDVRARVLTAEKSAVDWKIWQSISGGRSIMDIVIIDPFQAADINLVMGIWDCDHGFTSGNE